MDYSRLPKIELHLHLDCSLSYEVVKVLAPWVSIEEFQANFIAPAKCTDLADYILRAIKGVDLMQTEEQLRLVTLDLFRQLKADHVIYAEIRFAPLLHTNNGLSPEQVVSAVNQAVEEGKADTGIEAGLILCTLRHFSKEQSMATVHLVEQFAGSNVVGFDIAADEAGFPVDNHLDAFAYAHARGMNITAHAGEAKGAESVWETLKCFHPSRIGHGVRSAEDPQLLEHLKSNDIHLEVCPTSNVQTNVVESIHDHPADLIYRKGVSMSVNTDARTISNVSLAHEYALLERTFHWSKEHFLRCNLEAIRHAFVNTEKKEKLINQIMESYHET